MTDLAKRSSMSMFLARTGARDDYGTRGAPADGHRAISGRRARLQSRPTPAPWRPGNRRAAPFRPGAVVEPGTRAARLLDRQRQNGGGDAGAAGGDDGLLGRRRGRRKARRALPRF